MKDILRQDVAECNAKMLGEVKDAIKDIQGELKDSLRQDFADNNTKMLGKLKDSLLPVGVMKDILRQDIADSPPRIYQGGVTLDVVSLFVVRKSKTIS